MGGQPHQPSHEVKDGYADFEKNMSLRTFFWILFEILDENTDMAGIDGQSLMRPCERYDESENTKLERSVVNLPMPFRR